MISKNRFRDLRSLARDQGVKRWYQMNKSELCNALGVKIDPIKKFSLTCVKTATVTTWESGNSIAKFYKVSPCCVFYAIKVEKPLKTSVGSFIVKIN